MSINSISFGKIVKMDEYQTSVERKAALVADLANGGEKKYTGGSHKSIAKEIKQIFNDIKPLDKATQADVLYVGEETYVVSGEDAKKTSRLSRKFNETQDTFYFNQLEEVVKESREPFALSLKVGGNQKSSMKKVNILV